MRLSTSIVAVASILLAGCATIMHGTSEDIGFSSTPTNAKISVDNQPVGQTPTIAKLSRKDNHIVRMELDGYQPFEATLTRNVSGWVWGNIIFGGVVGLAVDAMSGGLYKLSPEQVSGQLAQVTQAGKPGAEQASTKTSSGIYVAVVLQPDPSWRKIGQLSPASR